MFSRFVSSKSVLIICQQIRLVEITTQQYVCYPLNHLDITASTEIGLPLSISELPQILKMGAIFAYFSVSGKREVLRKHCMHERG